MAIIRRNRHRTPADRLRSQRLALAYAQAHPDRVSGIVLRATFLGTRSELEGAFLDALPRFYPDLGEDFLKLLPPEERAQPLDAYWRRILDSDPAVHGAAARAWHDTERILSEHTSGRVRLDPDALNSTRALPSTPFMEAHYFQNDCFMRPNQLLAEAGKLRFRVIVQGCATTCSVHLRPFARTESSVAGIGDSFRRGRRPFAVRSRHQGCRDEGDFGSGFQD
jgi:pimeloyl-ACP methyl ester carboxylesterase